MLWIFFTFIFIRPFISSLAYPYLNATYSILFLVFCAAWVKSKGISKTELKPLKFPLILFYLGLAASILFSQNKLASLGETYKYIAGLLIFCIVVSLEQKNKKKLITVILLSGLIVSLIAIRQYFWVFKRILIYLQQQGIDYPFALDYIGRKRAFAPFVTPNTLGGYLAMIIPLSLISKKTRWFIIPISLAFLLTKSLGALFSIFGALIIYFIIQNKWESKKIIILCVIIVVIGSVLVLRAQTPKLHNHPIFSTLMRLNYWKDTLKIIRSSPFSGVGPGNFNLTHSRYAHNSYLQILAEMGIFGLISVFWLVIIVLKDSYKNKLEGKKLLGGLLIANAAFLLHNFIDFTFFLPEVSFIWWAILGLSRMNQNSGT